MGEKFFIFKIIPADVNRLEFVPHFNYYLFNGIFHGKVFSTYVKV